MRITLEDLRLYFGDRKSDVVSAVGMAAFGLLLLSLARLSGNQILALVAFLNFAFLWVPVGSLWQKKRTESRWQQAGLDGELLRHCEALARIDASLDEYVDTVLSVYTTIFNLSRQNAWFHRSAEFQDHLASVREGVLAFFQRVERVDALRRMYDLCAQSLRRPGRLASLQARVDKEYKLLETFADAFEGAMLDFSEAMAAAMGAGGERAMTAQLHEFAGSMRRLAQSIDEVSTSVGELDEELDAGVSFDRLLAADDALAFDDEPTVSQGIEPR
jgi:hypothetical protein